MLHCLRKDCHNLVVSLLSLFNLPPLKKNNPSQTELCAAYRLDWKKIVSEVKKMFAFLLQQSPELKASVFTGAERINDIVPSCSTNLLLQMRTFTIFLSDKNVIYHYQMKW